MQVPLFYDVLQCLQPRLKEKVLSSHFVKDMLRLTLSGRRLSLDPYGAPHHAPMARSTQQHPPRLQVGVGSWDLAVLRPENQNTTHVTPLIDSLAQGWFHEHLHVVDGQSGVSGRWSKCKYRLCYLSLEIQ